MKSVFVPNAKLPWGQLIRGLILGLTTYEAVALIASNKWQMSCLFLAVAAFTVWRICVAAKKPRLVGAIQ